MNNIISTQNNSFENIKIIKDNSEFWSARDLMRTLDYLRWENFDEVIKKAKTACQKSNQDVKEHFRDVTKTLITGNKAKISITDIELDRYACYLIAQNGDSRKPQIALAQTYFAIQTRRQELTDQLNSDNKRLFIRSEVTAQNKKLFSTATKSGVKKFGLFNDAGYRGLYNHTLSEIEHKKKIKKGELLDRAGSTELAANLFRITQTEDILSKNKNIHGDIPASNTHYQVGRKVRKTIEEIGGTPPELLPAEKNIKILESEIKKLK
ncbi:DNA damage-inducible protein D [Candidatus Shapirobacteria bacterium CG_4_8_14_3_um_filter_35_11]|uniref:DNA damage-inducible protein D n=4 Tax=Candidatus Shapironibacteriota TaxID=1752721 RepID=A0A1J5I1P9_9BACT|nr:MAG: DNA damage-inducible protein D [Candidatus Shapirobacteria bacterium CG2_30_35_20]PIX68278.1 MAG: DNA damage-inducible protein D [Candidatus Shapirobacteria bacterium CG_4_10_14_3_um_filter_35_13]PJA50848.1 MAG: DNA damage-inducible protein D [Candidatus Shapirobacteria bacterium CG_4_9_14_3_um_filter_36_12]PJC79635.1 MAG: DNA damage-inducible protein D [Candidatus Shapirobacteria bacterium CG_4_8_14_3_um_filter_35_11]